MAKKTPFEAFRDSHVASALLGYSPPVTSEDALPQLAAVFASDGSLAPQALELDTEQVLDQDGVREMFESGYLPPTKAMKTLRALPKGTLGRCYSEYLESRNQLPPQAPEGPSPRDPTTYVQLRLRLLHSLIHVVTGYDGSIRGEMAVQCFFLGQVENAASTTIVATAMAEILRTAPEQLPSLLSLMAEAFTRGRDSRPVLSVPWEEFWPAPLADVMELAGITPRGSNVAALVFQTPEPSTSATSMSTATSRTSAASRTSQQARSSVSEKPAPDSPRPRQTSTSSLVAAFAQLNREASASHEQNFPASNEPDEPVDANMDDDVLSTPSPLGIPMDDDDLEEPEAPVDAPPKTVEKLDAPVATAVAPERAKPKLMPADIEAADGLHAETVFEPPQAPYPGEDDTDYF
ncbi:MAG: Coq4 family protein [Nannocystaceae bacterium]